MPKFAPVAPIQVLEGLYDQSPDLFGDYHLLLAHHTVEHIDRFATLFSRIEDEGKIRPTIIMDNSVVELGGAVDFGMIQAAVDCIVDNCENASVIPVLPDVMGEGNETRIRVAEAYDRWSREMEGSGFMAVAQGRDFEDFQKSLHFLSRANYPEITYIGIPRWLTGKLGSRGGCVEYFTDFNMRQEQKQQAHLLGFSDDVHDDIYCCTPHIMGIDSAVPLRYPGVFGPLTAGNQIPPRPTDWFDTATVTPEMMTSLENARRMVEQGRVLG